MSQNPQGSYGQSGYTQPGQPGGSGPQDRTQAGVPQRLTPPEGAAVLTLEAPAPPPVVQATQAPELAPPVTEEQRPALDAKVNQFMGAIMAEQSGSPEFSRQADANMNLGHGFRIQVIQNLVGHFIY